MTKILSLLLLSCLALGCVSAPISYEAIQQPLAIIAEYDYYFRDLQSTSRMLDKMGAVDRKTGKDFTNYSNAAYVHYLKAHTALAEGNIKEFQKYINAAYGALRYVEKEITVIMKKIETDRISKDGV